jgi:hypothetical protein
MGDWATLFKNFIYRDVAFILGGSIVLASFAYCFDLFPLLDKAKADLYVPLAIALAALAYVVGYGVQDIGGVIHLSSTAVPYPPSCFDRCLYRAFTRSEWRAVNYVNAAGPFEEFEIEMGRRCVPTRTLQALDRILSLKVISMCIGACALLGALFVLIHWFRHPSGSDIVLFIAGLVFGIALICLGRLKAMQEMQFYQAMNQQDYPRWKATPES